jgi:hypothetical protein
VQLVDDAALVVALEIVDFVLRECLAQLLEVAVEITMSVNLRLTLAQEIQIRTVYYEYVHVIVAFLV